MNGPKRMYNNLSKVGNCNHTEEKKTICIGKKSISISLVFIRWINIQIREKKYEMKEYHIMFPNSKS